MRKLLTVVLTVILTVVAAIAWGFWTAGAEAGGNGGASATTVNQGATPTGNAVGSAVTVTWTASTLANAQAVGGYLVKRYHSGTGVVQTILSACTGTITALSCVESSVPAGSWKYTVTPKIGTNWLGQESSQSGTVTVTPPDTTAPANAITLSSVSGGAYKSSATNIFYRGVAAGSFTLTNAVTDADSGPASSQTAALGNTPTNWTHTGSTVSTPAGGPYVSNVFSWTAGATSSPTETVTGRDVAANTAVANLTFTLDSTAPSAGTISYLDGYQPGHSVPVTFTTGTDGGSGIATRQLQRQSAPLTSGTCGTYTGWSDRGPDSPTSVYTDSSVVAGNCYKYQYLVTDRVGNQHIATSASVSKIDYAGAVDATTGLLSHWRLGENATSIANDTFTATNGTLLTSRNSDSGHTWTYLNGTNNEQINTNRITSTDAGRATYYSNVVPTSPDYSVEADVFYKGTLAGDMTGVFGRGTMATPTYYMARYEQADQSWNLVKYSGTTPTYLTYLASQPLTVGQTYNLRLEMTGTTRTTLRLFVNDVLTVSHTDTTTPITVVGVAGIMEGENGAATVKSTAAGLHLDNWKVTNLRAADSKGSNHAAYVNDPTRSVAGALTGDADTAAQFDGVDDYVQAQVTTSIPVGATNRSVEAWFKTTSNATRQVIFHYGTMADTQQFGLWIANSGTTMTAWGFGGTNDKSFTMPYAVNDGAWHQVVQTYNGTTLTLYIDGVALATQAATRGTVMNSYGFGIGAVIETGNSNSGGFFAGSIDEVSFYTTTLSQTDVTNHYQLGTVTVPEPIVTTTGTALTYLENGTTAVDDLLTLSDADSADLTAATVDMTTNYLDGQDTLAFTNQNGITGTWTASTGVMALSGSATVAQYQTALRSITYNNNSNYPNTSIRTVTFEVSDGTNTSNIASRNITVTAVNDAPAGSPATLTLNEDATNTFTTADFGFYDTADNGTHSLLAVKITTLPALGTLTLSGVNVTAGQTVSAANITSGLLVYTPPLNANGTGYTSFTFQVQDNGGTANSGIDLDASPNTITFDVTAVNDAPVNSVPATQSTLTNTPKVFSVGNGNLISISDPDAAAASVQAQLVSTNGTTTLSTVAGLSFSVGDGTADTTMTFTGTVTAVNTALAGLSFNPTTSFTGAASLQIVTSDQGNTGTGGTLTDSDTITINVSGRPVITTTGANLTYTENASATVLDSLITVVDADSNVTGATVSMTTNYVNGQDTLAFTNQLGITGSWSAGTGVLTLSGTTTDANYQTAMRTITYVNSSENPAASNRNVNFVVSDAVGASNTATRQVAVTAVNDAPVNTVPGTQTTAVNTNEVFTGGSLISIADDAASSSMQVQLVSTNGTSTISPLTGLSFSVGDGTADATMTFTGTVAAVNTALAGLTFAPRINWVGTGSVQVVTSDQGNTGTGGTLTDDDTVNITVTSSYGIFAATSGVGATGGSANYANPTYTVVGEGTGIGSTTDQYQYLYTTLTGDGTLTAQVASITNPCGTWGYSGVMMRDSLATNSMFAMADQQESGNNFADQRYRTTNGGTSVTTATAATVPEWVRITRTGNSFTTFRSADGSAWTAISVARTIAMGSTIYVGLAATSGQDGCFNTSTFNNVSLTQPSTPPVLAASGGTTAHTENVPVVVDSGITVTDVDDTNMESGTVTVGTGYTAGQDVLAFTNQNGITGSWSAPTLTLTGSATKANWQTALRSITYNNTSDTPNTGNRTINFVVNDGNSDSNTAAKTVSVAAANDAPVNSVPGAQTTATNTAKVFSTGNGNLISITDVDAAGGTMQVQLVSTNGATTLSTLTGLTFTVGDGTADATMTFTGSFAAVNTALAGLSFNPATSFNGAASLQIVTSDQGNTGTGGTLTDDDTVTVNVNSLGIFTANQDIGGPSIAGSSSYSAGTYTVSGSGADIWGASDQFQYLTVPMTDDGRLTARVVSDTTPHASAKAGVMVRNTLTSGSVHALMNIQASLGSEFMARTVDSQTPSHANGTAGPNAPYWVRITRIGNIFTGEHSADGATWATQGVAQTVTMGATAYFGLAVSAHTNAALHTATFDNVALTVPTPPALSASGGTTAHTENVPVVVDSAITVTDTDDANMSSGTVTVGSGYTAGQDVLAFTNQNGITGSWSAPTMTLTGSASKANWQTALRSITYNNTSNTPNTGNRTINFVVNDGSANSNTGAKTVSVAAANDAPANSVPGAQSTAMNTAKVFSSGNGNLISITDVDAAGGTMQVQLVSTNGATTLSTLTGLSFSVGDGTADATMTFTGSFAAVNTALSGLSFNPTTSFTGAASLQIVTADQGNTGTGGTLTDNDTVAITVTGSSYYDTIFGESSLINYYRLGEDATSSDAMTGTAGATLQSRSGAIGASWTKHGVSDADAVLTAAGRVRKGGAPNWSTLYHASGAPASADYTVETDLYVASNLANDHAGVVGRMDTTANVETYYLARYEQPGQTWALYRRVGGSWVWLGASAQALTPGTTYRLALDMTGTSIRVLVDGVQRVAVTDAGITAAGRGGVSFGFGGAATTVTNTTGLHLDNFGVIPPMADSEGTNHGDYFGGVTLGQAGAIAGNNSVLFDGADDYGSITRQISTDFTIEFWFKSSNGVGSTEGMEWPNYAPMVDGNIVSSNPDFGVSLSAGGVVYAGMGASGGDVTIRSVASGYDDGNWHYVAVTRTGTTFKLYVDGAAVVNGTSNQSGAVTTPSITFGRSAAGSTIRWYTGNLDEIAFYNAVLAPASVTAHYAAR